MDTGLLDVKEKPKVSEVRPDLDRLEEGSDVGKENWAMQLWYDNKEDKELSSEEVADVTTISGRLWLLEGLSGSETRSWGCKVEKLSGSSQKRFAGWVGLKIERESSCWRVLPGVWQSQLRKEVCWPLETKLPLVVGSSCKGKYGLCLDGDLGRKGVGQLSSDLGGSFVSSPSLGWWCMRRVSPQYTCEVVKEEEEEIWLNEGGFWGGNGGFW
jgi:hypothetical protein